MKEKFDATKAAKRKALEQNPSFSNLFRLEIEIDRFAPAILALYPESYKCWNKEYLNSRHCILSVDNVEEIPIYFSKYTPDILHRDISKREMFCSKTLFGNFCGNTLTVYKNIYDVFFTIIIDDKNDKDFIFSDRDGVRIIEYNQIKIPRKWLWDYETREKKLVTFQDKIVKFRRRSLVAQAAKANKTIAASKGGKAKAAKQTGYKQVKMMFQHKNGECPTEETKSVIDAYKICAKHTKSRKGGGAISLREFRRKIPAVVTDMYDGYKIDCDKFFVYLSFGVVNAQRGRMSRCPNYNTIYKITDKNSKNVDKVNGLITLAGHSVPQTDKPSKDNHKKTTRRSKNLPCGHKACPINNLVKINKIVKVEKWRKFNQVITEAIEQEKQELYSGVLRRSYNEL